MKNISGIFALIVLLVCQAGAMAQTGIRISPVQGESSVEVVDIKAYSGSCGNAVVRVVGVVKQFDNFFTADPDASIFIRNGAKDIQLSSGVMSEYNGIACVSSKSGPRILVWSNCAGSACTEFSFYVIDPNSLVFVAPQDPKKGVCDERCASQATNSQLPKKINGKH